MGAEPTLQAREAATQPTELVIDDYCSTNSNDRGAISGHVECPPSDNTPTKKSKGELPSTSTSINLVPAESAGYAKLTGDLQLGRSF